MGKMKRDIKQDGPGVHHSTFICPQQLGKVGRREIVQSAINLRRNFKVCYSGPLYAHFFSFLYSTPSFFFFFSARRSSTRALSQGGK